MSTQIIMAWDEQPGETARDEPVVLGGSAYVVAVEESDSGVVRLDVDFEEAVAGECAVKDRSMAEFMKLKPAGPDDLARRFQISPLRAAEFLSDLTGDPSEGNRFFMYDPDRWESVPSPSSPGAKSGRSTPRKPPRAPRPSPTEVRRAAIREAVAAEPRSVAALAEATKASTRTIQRDVEAMGLAEVRSGREIAYALRDDLAPSGGAESG